jgi:hypothetical protein
MKSKFKVMDILRLIDKQHNMTVGGLYCANCVFDNGADIPVIETVDDYGLVVSLYETSFEATDIVLDFSSNSKMSEEDAKRYLHEQLDACLYQEEKFVSSFFITKIQQDKELQKALLSLIKG